MQPARLWSLVVFSVLVVEPSRVLADASFPASEARALADPRAIEDASPTPPEPDTFEGPGGLELSLGVGSASSLAVGLLVAPELAIDLVLGGVLAQIEDVTLATATLAVALEISFVRPRVGEVVPLGELLLGSSFPLLVPPGWQAYPRGFASIGLGVGYVLDAQLAIRAIVSPTFLFDEATLVLGVNGQIALVARV
jgi:hypothetical protein